MLHTHTRAHTCEDIQFQRRKRTEGVALKVKRGGWFARTCPKDFPVDPRPREWFSSARAVIANTVAHIPLCIFTCSLLIFHKHCSTKCEVAGCR